MNNEDVFKARVKEMIDGLRLSVTDQRKQLDAIVKDAVKIIIKCVDNINEASIKMELKGAEMREIKFRGISKETNEWVYGCYYHHEHENDHYIKKTSKENGVYDYRMVKIYPETLGQYTGMRDINCKEIYEGDIIKTQYRTSPIAFHNNAFKAKSGTYGWDDMDRLSMPTVIGTIHDGKYGMSEEDKKILEAHIQILKGIQGELRNLGLNYKTVDVNSVIGCINDAMSAIYEIKEVKE